MTLTLYEYPEPFLIKDILINVVGEAHPYCKLVFGRQL